MTKKIISIVLLVACSLVACKKSDPDKIIYPYVEPGFIKLSPAALEFVQLPLNRYFIYKDSATGSTDSVRVTKSVIEKMTQPIVYSTPGCLCYGSPAHYYETYTLTLTKITGMTNQTWFQGNSSSDIDPYYFLDSSVEINPSFSLTNQQTNLSAFSYPFSSSNVIPLLIIEGTNYANVHEFITTNGLQPSETNYQEVRHYWVKGIGIIKKTVKTFNTVQTFLLVRHG